MLLRVALRSRLHSSITIFGLTLGLTISFLIMMFVWFETHYEVNFENSNRTYRVEALVTAPGRETMHYNMSMGPTAGLLLDRLDYVEQAGRSRIEWHSYQIEDGEVFNAPTYLADQGFLEIFFLDFIAGGKEGLQNQTSIIISESRAELLFGSTDVVGKVIQVTDGRPLNIVGVFKDLPENTHLTVDMLIPLNSPQQYIPAERVETSWRHISVQTYVLTKYEVDPVQFAADINKLVEDTAASDGASTTGSNAELIVEPIKDIHLFGGPYRSRNKPAGNPEQLRIISVIGILVLAVACFNYVNISTARAMTRAREVAMRKVVGAGQKNLVVQFLGETMFYVLLSWFLALVILDALLPIVNDFMSRNLTSSIIWNPGVVMWQVAILGVVIIASGLYPAFYLSRFNPIQILKEQTAHAHRKISLRTVLVVLQFAASVGLIIAASVIYIQTNYARNVELGFDKEDMIALYGIGRGPAESIRLSTALDNAIAGKPGIISVSGSEAQPSWDHQSEARLGTVGMAKEDYLSFNQLAVDLDYFETYKVDLVSGRAFSQEFASDTLQWDLEKRETVELPLIINKKGVRTLGFNSEIEAVDQTITIELWSGALREARIVGVVDDFHFRSIRNEIEPMVFYPDPSRFATMSVRIDPNQRDTAIESIQNGWNQVLSYQSMGYGYLDQAIIAQYVEDERLLIVVAVLAAIAILIAGLGLYGLAAFNLERRIKEIGIRKVLGAETGDIVRLVAWQFSQPVLFANLIAWPITWFAIHQWLAGFAYRIDLTLVPFLITGLAALIVAILTVGGQAMNVARSNPVNALKYE
nr:ABC transporter permease [Kordiimonas sp. SCSIO 12610]